MNAAVVGPISEEMVLEFDEPGPRYTSYPGPDRFVEAFAAEEYAQSLRLRRTGAAAMSFPLSIYVHIPFCESLCYYCACNTITTPQHDHAAPYLRYLTREVELHVAQMGVGQRVTQLHLGGGAPLFFSDDELHELMAMLRRNFILASGGDYSIEIDPRFIDAARLDTLAELGFTRLSLGVQDFDPEVQKAVHRAQSSEQVIFLVEAARKRGFDAVHLDLIYGLPKQSQQSFERTLAQVIELRPDRIALYAYAHLPERFKPQRSISAFELPDKSTQIAMQLQSLAALMQADYVHLGMGQFALSTDPLAIAKRQGRMHRNFQGYSTQPDCDLIGLGVSSMGHMGATYSQNTRSMEAYCDCLDQGRFPVMRGLALSRDDLVRRAVIMAILCHGEVLFESIELAHLVDFNRYFSSEMEALHELADQGLVTIDKDAVQVTDVGRFFVHMVAVVFDRYLQADRTRARFSKII